MQLRPDPQTLARFAADLDALAQPGIRIGVAVSGGPDSLALLLLCAAARPGEIEAATVDHGLRPESASEAGFVAGVCESLGVPHATLAAEWQALPESAVQKRARVERYRLLAGWMDDRGLKALAAAHHLDDQAETFVMRLIRGAGVRGLAAIRPVATVPGSNQRLVRPLLGWRRPELEEICARAGFEPVSDPSNCNDQYERVRVRQALAASALIDPAAVARSAGHLADADAAIEWAVDREWRSITRAAGVLTYKPGDAPLEIRRRVAGRAIAELANEGGEELRGRELDRLIGVLACGGTATLRGVRCVGGNEWTFSAAAPRRS